MCLQHDLSPFLQLVQFINHIYCTSFAFFSGISLFVTDVFCNVYCQCTCESNSVIFVSESGLLPYPLSRWCCCCVYRYQDHLLISLSKLNHIFIVGFKRIYYLPDVVDFAHVTYGLHCNCDFAADGADPSLHSNKT